MVILMLESPLYATLGGGFLVILCLIGYFNTQIKQLLIAAVAIAAISAGLVVLESVVVTHGEELDATIHEIRDHVQDGDIESAVDFVHASAAIVKNAARNELMKVEVEWISIKDLDIDLLEGSDPPEATVGFNVVVRAQFRGSGGGVINVPRFVKVNLVRTDNIWQVLEYSHDHPLKHMRQN